MVGGGRTWAQGRQFPPKVFEGQSQLIECYYKSGAPGKETQAGGTLHPVNQVQRGSGKG